MPHAAWPVRHWRSFGILVVVLVFLLGAVQHLPQCGQAAQLFAVPEFRVGTQHTAGAHDAGRAQHLRLHLLAAVDTRRGKDLMGTFLSDIVLQVLSFVAENERTNIRQRQAEGIAAAKARGVKFGRPPRPLPDNFYEVHKAWRDKKLTLKEAAETCDLPVGTFYGKSIQFEKST